MIVWFHGEMLREYSIRRKLIGVVLSKLAMEKLITEGAMQENQLAEEVFDQAYDDEKQLILVYQTFSEMEDAYLIKKINGEYVAREEGRWIYEEIYGGIESNTVDGLLTGGT